MDMPLIGGSLSIIPEKVPATYPHSRIAPQMGEGIYLVKYLEPCMFSNTTAFWASVEYAFGWELHERKLILGMVLAYELGCITQVYRSGVLSVYIKLFFCNSQEKIGWGWWSSKSYGRGTFTGRSAETIKKPIRRRVVGWGGFGGVGGSEGGVFSCTFRLVRNLPFSVWATIREYSCFRYVMLAMETIHVRSKEANSVL